MCSSFRRAASPTVTGAVGVAGGVVGEEVKIRKIKYVKYYTQSHCKVEDCERDKQEEEERERERERGRERERESRKSMEWSR